MPVSDPIAVADSEGMPPPGLPRRAEARKSGPFVILLSPIRDAGPTYLLGPRGNFATHREYALDFPTRDDARRFVEEQRSKIVGYNAYAVDWSDPITSFAVAEDDGDPD